ncbi:RrF2 family transcriptional regulator [Ilumatobacter sp.]|uniref:RrF2 family transcriptional regulator n=1 Tax=Ilumatobacter sp. TaxID=1967498 RepID=UPI003AF87E77
MRLGEGVEWALHCCSVLGSLPPGVTLPGARLAEFHDVPASYLAKHLQALSNAGVVEPVTGRNGGYRLARPAGEITVLDVVLAVNGDEPAFRCSEIRQRGPSAIAPERYVQPCGIARAMWDAESAWRASLRDVTIGDLVADLGESVDPAQIDKAIDWMGAVLR